MIREIIDSVSPHSGYIASSAFNFTLGFAFGALNGKTNIDYARLIGRGYPREEELTRKQKLVKSLGNGITYTALIDIFAFGVIHFTTKNYLDIVQHDPEMIAGFTAGYYLFSKKAKPREPKKKETKSISIKIVKSLEPKPKKVYGQSFSESGLYV